MAKMKSSYFGLLCAFALLTGCQIQQPGAQFSALPGPSTGAGLAAARDHIRVNDTLKIIYTMPAGVPALPTASERVGDDGRVRLLHNKTFVAAGKTTRQLEEEIIAAYVPDYYQEMNVSVDWQDNTQFFYVDGEVKSPNRHVYLGTMTVLKAIASANGFTDYARKSKVVLTRADGQIVYIDCLKAERRSELDPEVLPGDRIFVSRKNPFTR